MLVTNIPLMWSLVRDVFPGLKRWINNSSRDYEAHSWPKNTSSARCSRLSQELALQIVTSTTTTTSASREHIVLPVPLSQMIDDDDLEKGGKGMILVQNNVVLEVEHARGSRRDYPVWDWTGNVDHVSKTNIAGGHIGMAK